MDKSNKNSKENSKMSTKKTVLTIKKENTNPYMMKNPQKYPSKKETEHFQKDPYQ